MKYLGILLMAAFAFSGCAGWQDRADDLQANLKAFVDAGHKTKDDFLREFGLPLGCAPLATGELCEWLMSAGSSGSAYSYGHIAVASSKGNSEILRIEFNRNSEYVNGLGVVHDGSDQYIGGRAPARVLMDPDVACGRGEAFTNGRCSPIAPGATYAPGIH